MTATQHRSYSQVSQLRRCGWQYKLERLDRVPSRPSVPAVAGKIFHTISEEIDRWLYENNQHHNFKSPDAGLHDVAKWKLNDLRSTEIAKEADHTGFGPETWRHFGKQDLDWFLDTGIPQMIDAYIGWRVENPHLKLAELPGFGPAIEVPFNYYINGTLVHGWIDRVFTSDDGGFYPLDLKSGKKPATDEQLGLYGQALKAGVGWEPTWGYYLYDLKSGVAKQTPPLNIAHWTPEKLAQVYESSDRAIKAGLFIPHPGDSCFVCSVSDSCEFVQAVV
jgi:hypothetical protein